MQPRKDVRVDTEMEIVVKTIYRPDGTYVPAMLELKMRIVNMSANGIMIACKQEFEEETSFYFDLNLGSEIIKVMPIIVRKIRDEKRDEWLYGCRFLDLDSKQEQIIRRYVFETELMKRRGK